jgi:hypothetical protein
MNHTYSIHLDYPLHSEPRYGWGKPPHGKIHDILNKNRAFYAEHLHHFLNYKDNYTQISKHLVRENKPAWINGSLPALDAASLYGFIAHFKPKHYVEIGIGNSTKFARQAIDDFKLDTRIIAIDPYPPPAIEKICDILIQKPLENIDLEIFDTLNSGDILFVDNTHRVFMNSDVTVLFLDILPRLRSGVLVEIHDIALPVDYPPHWVEKYYSEQYLLAAYLLAEGQKFEVILPNAFISLDSELSLILNPIWQDFRMNGNKDIDLLAIVQGQYVENAKEIIETHGSSFWIKIN